MIKNKQDKSEKLEAVNALIESKKKAVESIFTQVDKQYGKGAIMLLGQVTNQQIDSISTGSILIDEVTGVGGFPRGRVIEIYGPEASGKTTLALHVIAQAQKKGGICAFIDAEHALDPQHSKRLGVITEDLIISQPDSGEQALEIAEMLIRSNAVDMVVIDSVSALVPRAELEGEMGDAHVGLQARLMSQALRKLTPIVHKSKTVLVFINQVRQNINSMPYAPKETTSGGNALKFYASMRIDIRRIGSLKKDDVHFGNRIAVKIVKNKVASPFRVAEVDLLFNQGISKELDLIDAALEYEVIAKSGSWLSFDNKQIAQGREQAVVYLKNNPEIADTILEKVRSVILEKKALKVQ
ncbi:MAG: recombinase RecA [Candidatus Babeliales bacterium]|nr:recombinase RecA [Candidatus Babeliales bacterium]